MRAYPKAIDVQTLTERHVGVESELGIRGRKREDLPPELEPTLEATRLLQSIGYDGGGREFRTTPISVKSLLEQARGRKRFEDYYQELSRCTEVLSSGGTHVHISLLGSDHVNIEANAMALATGFFEQFQKVAGRQSPWANKLNATSWDEINKWLRKHRASPHLYRAKGSMFAPTGHKTLEFRGPKGSNSFTEVLAWIDFVNCVAEVANRKSVDGVQFRDLLGGSYIAEYVASLPADRVLSKLDLDKTLNVTNLQPKEKTTNVDRSIWHITKKPALSQVSH